MAEQTKILICVTEDNRNKIYKMVDDGDGNFTAHWGRVGATLNQTKYGMNKWGSQYNAKLKGKVNKKTGKREPYIDQTELYEVSDSKVDFANISDRVINKIVTDLQRYANKSVSSNYTVSSEAVTQKQVDEAQSLLDEVVPMIALRKRTGPINKQLLELFRTIPRKMGHVKDFLIDEDVRTISDDGIRDNVQNIVQREQDTLDVMRGQVGVHTAQTQQTNDDQQTLLEAMGIEMWAPEDKEIATIKKMLGNISNKFYAAYCVKNLKNEKRFQDWLAKQKNKKCYLYWHGSRNENWWSILDTGLVLRPTNAVITGKYLGYGTYFANRAKKSLGYSSLHGSYWAGGSSNRGFLSLYNVHVGKSLVTNKHQYWMNSMDWKRLQKEGDYHSMFFKGGANLINDEIVVYLEEQTSIRFLVELK